MPITPLPPYVASFLPLSNITPFTYKDGETYLKELERMEKYIFGTLVPYVQDNFESLGEDFQTQVNLVITTVNEQLALQDAAVTAELAAQLATLTDELALKADLVAGKVPDAQLPARVIGLTPGSGIAVDATDPTHPIITNSGVIGTVAGTGIGVDNTDPHHPIISNNGVQGVTAGAHATVDNADPEHPIVSGTGIVEAIVAGTNVVVNNADPTHPIVSASGGGGGGGIVDTVVGSTHVHVDSTDPANPVVSTTGLVIGVSAGTGVTVDNTDPTHPIVSSAADGVLGITPGAHISVDNTDPAHPVVAATGLVDSVTAGSNITVNNTDPDNPIVSTVAKVTTVVAGTGISVNNADANNPVITSTVTTPGSGLIFTVFATQAAMNTAGGTTGDYAKVTAIPGAYFERISGVWIMKGIPEFANRAAITAAITAPLDGMQVKQLTLGVIYRYITANTKWMPYNSDWIVQAPVFETGNSPLFSVGNGTTLYRYRFVNGDINVDFKLQVGTTTVVNSFALLLPTGCFIDEGGAPYQELALGNAVARKGNGSPVPRYLGFVSLGGGDSTVGTPSTPLIQQAIGGTGLISATAPFTWAANDMLSMRYNAKLVSAANVYGETTSYAA